MAMKSLQKKLRANANLEGMTASGFQHGHVVRDRIIGAHRRPETHKTLALSELPVV
jgi:hypothetical protein